MAVKSDNPINQADDDLLNRAGHARRLARQVLAFDLSEGLVVGVLGPWGSGKTSFVNLMRSELSAIGAPILDFNPWMFSGAQQLVDSFFAEMASQLKLKPGLDEIGKNLEDYGETVGGLGWLPLVGTWIDRGRVATKVVGKVLQGRKQGAGAYRAKLASKLSGLKQPIVVIIDDVDRLTTPEIRDIFKLVRLTASFPNIIYIVSFDRIRVENALGEEGVPGRDYLEKILQLAVDLPRVPDTFIYRLALGALEEALESVAASVSLDPNSWPDVFTEVIRPLIRNMRDVRRYASAVRVTALDLAGEIQLVDVLALDAIRLFLPDTFSALADKVKALTTTSDPFSGGISEQRRSQEYKVQVEALIASADEKSEVVRALIRRCFPAALRHIEGSNFGSAWLEQWRVGRRVAHEDFLNLYLEKIANASLIAFNYAERAYKLMDDKDRFDAYLRGIEPDLRQDVISALEDFTSQFTESQVVPSSIVLFNLTSDLPDLGRGGLLNFRADLVISRVTIRLLRTLSSEQKVEQAVREILPYLNNLSAKLQLIGDVGHDESRGAKLVSEQTAKNLELEWRKQVRAAESGDLIREPNLLVVMMIAERDREEGEPRRDVDPSPAFTLAMLQSAKGEVRSATAGNRAISRSPRLAWDVLADIYGDEEQLKARVEELRDSNPRGTDDLLDLALRYASGWRPSEFGYENDGTD